MVVPVHNSRISVQQLPCSRSGQGVGLRTPVAEPDQAQPPAVSDRRQWHEGLVRPVPVKKDDVELPHGRRGLKRLKNGSNIHCEGDIVLEHHPPFVLTRRYCRQGLSVTEMAGNHAG